MNNSALDRWVQIQQYQVDLSVYGDVMRGATATQIDRDIATKKYICAVDCLVMEMDALAKGGVLKEIAEFLEARGRRLT